MDSNHRTPERTDLQSVVVGHLTTCPNHKNIFTEHGVNQYAPHFYSLPVFLSHLLESNLRPTDYKSAALPTELLWLDFFNHGTHIQRTKTDGIIRLFFWEGKGKRIC